MESVAKVYPRVQCQLQHGVGGHQRHGRFRRPTLPLLRLRLERRPGENVSSHLKHGPRWLTLSGEGGRRLSGKHNCSCALSPPVTLQAD